MGKTGYTAKAKKAYKRTGAYKKKTTSLVKRNTHNPVEYFSRRSKVFAPLPTSLGVRQTFTADPLFNPRITSPPQGTLGSGSKAAFICINVLDMLTSPNVDNQSGVLCNWHDTNHHALCQVYQEFAYQTTYISADFSMDSFPKDVTKPIVQQVQIVAKIVPISQIRIMIPPDISMNTVAFNPNSDFGKMFTGVDYYGMLTSQPGAQQCVITADGNRSGKRLTFKVDAFEHNGNPIKGSAVVRNTVDTGPFLPTQVQLWAQPVYPNLQTDQQVLMIAFRWSQHSESVVNLFEVRANLKCDQHYVYSDPHLATQDILYVPSTKHPDDR